ncbi:UDP-2,4-diacetamido-2,4,6-trideoxy-beta-L-altropyranose hydrolase [Chitinophaga arvensicola]|uniref:UDP-2,4-diacetamido-2,4,6-trideoxy-beta-L-altropyranose hydrolase n=1 Tax=Chitinophaga arvensicola TaxID=29529 RepID=A0A1I0NQB2_9BACT|nr:UDP-2,4-diacetamido-2,4,6-trideoxy-beta-L-altropyranose hydrolase [Chitinophaga arvensicola]SEW03429.1 UDP-2,4-diacetamido-2,4,6-trideoxy-beta-L-altropyranose hydrolase [Chitinophaga arvensicola]
MKRKVFFRADGNDKIGLGHVIRSCAMAHMLKEEFECHFFIRNPLPSLRQEILQTCSFIHELPDSIDYIEEAETWKKSLTGNEIVILDGYHFDTAYQKTIKTAIHKLVCIDDIHAYHFVADAVINHAEGLTYHDYSAEPYTEFFLGTKYALLRKEFLSSANIGEEGRKDDIFISLGGADINNDIIKVLALLEEKMVRQKCHLVIGSAYKHELSLSAFLKETRLDVSIYKNLSATDMVKLMKMCRFGICPPSSVSYEYLTVGGELYLHMTADNQKDINRFFLQTNLAFSLEDFPVADKKLQSKSRMLQQEYFDGQSDRRIRDILENLSAMDLAIRKADADDVQLYFDWVNDPLVREFAINTQPIIFENHYGWFHEKLKSDTAYLYVIEQNHKPVGQVRFDIDKLTGEAVIDYSVSTNYRGKGIGKKMLRVAIQKLSADKADKLTLIALVNEMNIPSCRIFEKLGFELEENDHSNGNLFKTYKQVISD